MDWTERRERLRAIVEGKRCIFPASVYDGISARIAGELGFEAMMFAGSVGSFSVLAAPDLCVLTLSEFAAAGQSNLPDVSPTGAWPPGIISPSPPDHINYVK